jgi:hypothetical protein
MRYGHRIFLPILRRKKELFEKNGVNVELLFDPDYYQVADRYALDEADGIAIVFSDAVLQNSRGIETKVVYTLEVFQFDNRL